MEKKETIRKKEGERETGVGGKKIDSSSGGKKGIYIVKKKCLTLRTS